MPVKISKYGYHGKIMFCEQRHAILNIIVPLELLEKLSNMGSILFAYVSRSRYPRGGGGEVGLINL